MDTIFTLIAFMAAATLIFFVIKLWREHFRQIDKEGYPYQISFNHLDKVPDLASHDDLKAYLSVVKQDGSAYIVNSKLNDNKLRELLLGTYQLSTDQVSVTPVRQDYFWILLRMVTGA